MRALLFDWLIEVAQENELCRDTLHYSLVYIDLYLAGDQIVKKSDFQLLGLTCLFMACKMEEIIPPLLEELVLFGCGSFNQKDMLRMEL